MDVIKLIEELKNKNEKSLDNIMQLYQNKVYNTCLGLLQNENDADEITQDVFVKMYQNISSFKGESAFTTWLYRIAVNESLQFLRRKKAKRALGFITSLFDSNNKDVESVDFIHPGVLVEQKENAQFLFKAIKNLPENQKVVFTLKNIEMLSQQEIASIMHLTEGAIESLLQRAKQNLRKTLKNII